MGPHYTIIKVNESKISVYQIFSFIQNQFNSYHIHNNTIHLSYLKENHHKHLFLMKWLYSIHKKVHQKDIKHLKELLIGRIEKPIKIVTKQDVELSNGIYIEILNKDKIRFFLQSKNYRLYRIVTYKLERFIVEKSYPKHSFDIDLSIDDAKIKLKTFLKKKQFDIFTVTFIFDSKKMQDLLEPRLQKKEPNIPLLEALKLLDSEQNEPIEVIQKRYKKLLVKFHPDNVYSEGSKKIEEYTVIFQNLQYSYDFITQTMLQKTSFV
jgi:hypothetical protein